MNTTPCSHHPALLPGGSPLRRALLIGLGTAGLLVSVSSQSPPPPRDSRPLREGEFRRELGQIQTAAEPDRLAAARQLLARGWVSSLQVKSVAASLPGDDARLEFALAAHPRTVDPENFYEVYDTFRSFSKVFRLHDAIQGTVNHPAPGPHAPPAPAPLSDNEFKDMVRTLKAENFDDQRLALGRQILGSARGRLQSRQVRELLKLFSFDDRRLELAKAGYDAVTDPWAYHVVNDTFIFATNREALARHIQERNAPPEPR
jgi:hypothetical protein